MVKVKICGITNLEDALAALFSGADAIGFVFYGKSPRYITPKKARNISLILPKRTLRVGVFADGNQKSIKKIAKDCGLNILQFHGNESPGFCQEFKNFKVIKAFKVDRNINRKEILKYKTFAYLFDTFSHQKKGGTGKSFDWKLLKGIDKIGRPIFLSGGLNNKNIKQAIKTVRPDWVDVSSSVEAKPGKKSHKKVIEFIRAVKGKK